MLKFNTASSLNDSTIQRMAQNDALAAGAAAMVDHLFAIDGIVTDEGNHIPLNPHNRWRTVERINSMLFPNADDKRRDAFMAYAEKKRETAAEESES